MAAFSSQEIQAVFNLGNVKERFETMVRGLTPEVVLLDEYFFHPETLGEEGILAFHPILERQLERVSRVLGALDLNDPANLQTLINFCLEIHTRRQEARSLHYRGVPPLKKAWFEAWFNASHHDFPEDLAGSAAVKLARLNPDQRAALITPEFTAKASGLLPFEMEWLFPGSKELFSILAAD